MSPISPDFQDFFSHLTDNALKSIHNADAIARASGNAYIGTEHLLIGLIAEQDSTGAKILAKAGVTLGNARGLLVADANSNNPYIAKGLSEVAKLTLKMAYETSLDFGQDLCGTEHILYSILSQKNSRAVELLRGLSVDVGNLVREVEGFLNRQNESRGIYQSSKKDRRIRPTALDFFGTDLTALARSGKLDPVIGRDSQIKRVITILSRRMKNNPVLIGEPGVGKTAIVEGLAARIVSEDVPDNLLDKRVITLDLAGMVAGTKYRGEFEERLKKVISEIEQDKKIIVFVDELHLLVGTGSAEGSLDAANILKPSLARGKIRLIGATTTNEYTKYIEKDSALERRFQPVKVPPATEVETLKILKGLKKHYEEFHNVTFSDEVLQDTVRLAVRYINDRFLPDKAIDLLDEAGAHVKVDQSKTPPKLRTAQKDLQMLQLRIEESASNEDYEMAAKYKTEASQLSLEISKLQSKYKKTEKTEIKSDDVASVVARITGVPVAKVIKSEAKYLLNLDKILAQKVIGQDVAINAIVKAIRRGRSGISDSKRPIGSFIFLGPTGVGKTEMARVLAREYFGSEDSLIKIDMSEFGEKHNASRLMGTSAGYVGYDDGGQLTDKVRQQPYSVVLFDEIEKAHPDVYNLLLQILEDGRLTDGKGRVIDFTNTIVIMTSNIGADKLQKDAKLGFDILANTNNSFGYEKNREIVLEQLKKSMRPELLNRIDDIIVFNSLDESQILRILDIQISNLQSRLVASGVGIKVSNMAKKFLSKEGYDPKNGVRPLRRLLQNTLEDEISKGILEGKYSKGDIICVSTKGSRLIYKVDKEHK